MTKSRTLIAALVAGALAVSLSACGTTDDSSNGAKPIQLTIGSLGTSESQLVAQLYGQALTYEGYDVSYNPGIGDRTAYIEALKSGVVDIVPETIGSLLSSLDAGARYSDTSVIVSAIETIFEDQGVADKVVDGEPVDPDAKKPAEGQDLWLLDPAPAQDTYAFVMTKSFAKTHNLVTLGDLRKISAGISIGAVPGFDVSPAGRAGLDRLYGVRDWTFQPYESDSSQPLIEALIADNVQVIAIPSTSGDISSKGLVVLGDPNGLVVAQNIAPLVSDRIISDRVERILNRVSKKFTTEDLRELDAAVSKRSMSYESAARAWLLEHGFLG